MIYWILQGSVMGDCSQKCGGELQAASAYWLSHVYPPHITPIPLFVLLVSDSVFVSSSAKLKYKNRAFLIFPGWLHSKEVTEFYSSPMCTSGKFVWNLYFQCLFKLITSFKIWICPLKANNNKKPHSKTFSTTCRVEIGGTNGCCVGVAASVQRAVQNIYSEFWLH